MKSLVLLVLAIALASPATGCRLKRGEPEGGITVATWNIRWFPSGQPEPLPEDVERITITAAARFIRKVEPNILCIQEVRDLAAAKALAEATLLEGFRVVVCSEFLRGDGIPARQQVAILSNLPVLDSAWERWQVEGVTDPPRGYVYALLQAPYGPVAVFSTHLKSNFIREGLDRDLHKGLNRLKREAASRQLRAEAKRRIRDSGIQPVRILVAGDFNTAQTDDPRWEGETTLQEFLGDGYSCGFEGLPPHRTHTLPATPRYRAVTFDYVFHRGFQVLHPARVHPTTWVSDHRMVSMRLFP